MTFVPLWFVAADWLTFEIPGRSKNPHPLSQHTRKEGGAPVIFQHVVPEK